MLSATFLSCIDGTEGSDVGIKMDVHEAYVNTSTDSLYFPYSEEDIIEFEYNINTIDTKDTSATSIIMTYEDGVGGRPLIYDNSHRLHQYSPTPISIGSPDCDVLIYRMKAYSASLTDSDILANFIADARDSDEMIARYNRNQIYNDNNALTPDSVANACPNLRIIKIEAPHFTNDKKDFVKNTSMECIYKNGDPKLDNWKFINCFHAGQGTTSNESFEFRYDCCGDSKDGSALTSDEAKKKIRTDNKQIWRDFYEFVITSSDKEFKDGLKDWCIQDAMLYFYLVTLRYSMIDNRAKNVFPHWAKHYITQEEATTMGDKAKYYTIDDDAAALHNGYRFDLWAYDMDTQLGINNSGELSFPYGKEDTDYKEEGNPSSGYVFNAAESVLWCRIRDVFTQELRNMYQSVDSNCWSDSHLINEYEAWQNQFPEELWRIHYERLYIRTYRAGTVRFLNEMMNGRGKYHLRQWERDQHIYMGTKFLHTDVKSDQIMFRCNTPKKVVVKPDYTLKIIPYSDMYISVLYGNSPETTQVRAKAGQEYQITTDLTNMDDTAILIYAASRIEALNDLSACYIHDNDFSKASKLKTLIIGNNTAGYQNTFMTSLNMGNNTLLETLDIRNCPNLTGSVNLSACENLINLYADGTIVTSVLFANHGKIAHASLPSSINTLTLKNLKDLQEMLRLQVVSHGITLQENLLPILLLRIIIMIQLLLLSTQVNSLEQLILQGFPMEH